MKKFLLTLCALASLSAGAQTFEQDGLKYTITSASTVSVTDEATKQTGALTIPATVTNEGTAYSVTAVGDYAFNYSDITALTLPETMDSIGYCAFSSSKIATIDFNDGLKYIGAYAFSSNKNLTAIDVPASVEEIADRAFFGGYGASLATVTLHEGLKKIGDAAFYSQQITSVTLPATVDSIGSAFMSCSKLETVGLNEGLKYIGDGCFYECKALTTITLPSTLEEVGDELFMNAKALAAINIPASLKEIGNCFIAGTSVATITLDAANTNYVLTSDGVLYNASRSLLVAAPMTGLTSHTIDSKCLGILGGAFMGSAIETVTLPAGMVAIDDYAFCQSSLKEIAFPSSLVWVGEQAFASTKLTSVTLPANFPYINDGEFAGCSQLTTVTIPSGIKGIYNHAFYNCTALTTITCKGSTAATLEDWYEDYDHPFYNVPSSTKVYVPKGCKASYENAYWDDYLTLAESENGVLTVKSVSPAAESTFEKYAYYSFSVTFNESIELVDKSPEVYLRKGTEYSSATIAPASWGALVEAGNTLTVFGNDEDGYMDFFAADSEKPLYLVIPEGIVKGENGEQNERIVIMYNTKATGIEAAASSTTDSPVVERYNIGGMKMQSAQKGINIVRHADGTVTKVLVK